MKKRLFFLLLAALMMPLAMKAQPKLSVHIDTTVSACNSFTWVVDGISYTYVESGGYTKIVGDTLYILDLTIYPSYNINVTEEQDGGCTYTWGDSIFNTSGLHTQTFHSINGCDSTVTINLVLSGTATKTYTVTACESYTWKDSTYTANTSLTKNEHDAVNNCDSTLTLNLTIIEPTQKSSEDTVVACNFYVYYFNNQNIVIEEDGTQISTDDTVTYGGQRMPYSWTTANLRNKYHPRTTEKCYDSVFVMHFTVHNDVTTNVTAKACDSYTLVATDTTYTFPYSVNNTFKVGRAVNGCDSIVALNLTVNISPVVTIDGDLRVKPGASATLNGHCDQNVNFLWSTGSTEESITLPNVQGNTDVYLIGKNNTSGCSDTSFITVMANVAIDNADEAVMSVYPNPTSALVNISSAEAVKNVKVFNTVGQQVMDINGKSTIDLGNFVAGTYIFRIELQNGAVHTRTIVLKK